MSMYNTVFGILATVSLKSRQYQLLHVHVMGDFGCAKQVSF